MNEIIPTIITGTSPFALDLRIFLKTVRIILMGKGRSRRSLVSGFVYKQDKKWPVKNIDGRRVTCEERARLPRIERGTFTFGG